MLRTIGRLGITLLIASTLSIASTGSNLVLANALALAQVPEDSAPNRPQIPPSSKPSPSGSGSGIGTDSGSSSGSGIRVQCISGCLPSYPRELAGREGSARLKVVVDRNGNVIEAQVLGGTAVVEFLIDSNSNAVSKTEETSTYNQIAQAALAAVRQMKFTPPASGDRSVVVMRIHFAIAGTDFERRARERLRQNEREREVQQEELNLAPLQ